MAGSEASDWLEIQVRMGCGEQAEEPFIGILEVLELGTQSDEYDDTEDEQPTWPAQVRVFKDRDRYRVESLDGRLLTIKDREFTYAFHDPETPGRSANDDECARGAHGDAIQRRPAMDWRGDDFTRPTGPPRATRFLGRDAWEIELAPPSHKPSPYVMTVDAGNGMLLEGRSVLFGPHVRWLELNVQESLPDDLFTWDGDFYQGFAGSYEDMPEDIRSQIDVENAERRTKLEELGIGPMTVGVTAMPHLHEWDDQGSFYASFDIDGLIVLLRRPHSEEPWEREPGMPLALEWSDGNWDWMLRATEEFSAEQLEGVKRSFQAAEPPNEH